MPDCLKSLALLVSLFFSLFASCHVTAQAAPTTAKSAAKPSAQGDMRMKFRGPDYSGVYDCTGEDSQDGTYTGIVTMTLDPKQSSGKYGAYQYKLEVPGYGVYLGQAVSLDKHMAIHFVLTDQSTKDYGTAIATISKNKQGKVRFHKYYYEPEFKGGNHGTEDCVKRG